MIHCYHDILNGLFPTSIIFWIFLDFNENINSMSKKLICIYIKPVYLLSKTAIMKHVDYETLFSYKLSIFLHVLSDYYTLTTSIRNLPVMTWHACMRMNDFNAIWWVISWTPPWSVQIRNLHIISRANIDLWRTYIV